jgi:hypothetical protein
MAVAPRPRARTSGWARAARALACVLVPAALGAAVAGSGLACKKGRSGPAVELEDTRPVPPPVGHVADLFVTAPDQTYGRLRTKLGGPAALLPATFQGLVAALVGQPLAAAEQIDAGLPVVGAAVDDGRKGAVVLGVHLRDADKLRDALVAAPDAPYVERKDAGVAVLEPKPSTTSRPAALGIANHYLLVAPTHEDLMAVGPYVARTLPPRAKVDGEVVALLPRAALAGPITARLRGEWKEFKAAREQEDQELRRQHGGRAPDFGDPTAALADIEGKLERLALVLGDLDHGRVDFKSDDAGVHSVFTMTPASPGGLAAKEIEALAVGDTAPMLGLPRETVIAIVSHETAAMRKAEAEEQLATISRLLGERLAAPDKARLAEVLDAWTRARGDWLAAGVQWGSSSRALLVRGALADAPSLDKAMNGVFELSGVQAFREPIERFVGKMTVGKPAAVGEAKLVHVKREAPEHKDDKASKGERGGEKASKPERKGKGGAGRGKDEDRDFEVGWRADAQKVLFEIVVAGEVKPWLAAAPKEPGPVLGDDPEVAPAVRALGADASFVFLLEPLKVLLSMRARPAREKDVQAAPVLFSYGRTRPNGWIRFDVSYPAAAEFLRATMRN